MHNSDKLQTLWSIQYLRAVAAIMVVWHHALIQIEAYQALLPKSSFGANGVDLFFVISGVIMVLTTHGRQTSAWEFARRRLIRVVPLYWLVTIGIVICAGVAPQLFKTTNIGWSHVVQSLLFIPHYSPSFPGLIWPVLVPGWSLNYELFFYALFALCLPLQAGLAVVAVVVVLCALVAAGMLAGPFSSASLVSYTNPMLLQFACGVTIGWLYCTRRLHIGPFPAMALGLAGVALLALEVGDAYRVTSMTGSMALVLAALTPAVARWRSDFWRLLGDASYSVYLTHIPSLGIARLVFDRLHVSENTTLIAAGFMVFAMALSGTIGCLCYRYLERPMLRALSPRRKEAALPAAES